MIKAMQELDMDHGQSDDDSSSEVNEDDFLM